MHTHLLHDIGLSVVAATVLAFVARALRQPLILAYIGAGLLIGPFGLKWVQDHASITQISELGLAFLLFIVGLEIDLRALARSGKVAAVSGTAQVLFCALAGWGAAWLLGWRGLPAAYLGVASAFSSTMIVVKLLSDRGQLDTVSGRITLGVLLMQDVLAIVVLAVQPNLSNPALGDLGLSLVSGVALVAGAMAATRWVLSPLFRLVATSPEIVLIASISWCFFVSWAAIQAKFSIAMGALIAGVSMSAFPYTLDVVAKIRSLRDFFVTLFFVTLGMQISLGSPKVLLDALALSAVVLVNRFPPILASLKALRYGRRVALLSSISLSQVSEFSLVILSLGVTLKHVPQEAVTIVALSLVITSTVSTYLIQFDQAIVGRIVRPLARFGIVDAQERETKASGPRRHEVVLLGCHRAGSSLVPLLADENRDLLIVDFNPEVHKKLEARRIAVVYGDVSHADTLEHAGLDHAKVVISSVSDDFLQGTSNLKLLQQVRRIAPGAKVIVRAEKSADAQRMYDAGADYVLLPRHVIAEEIRRLLRCVDEGRLDEERRREVEALTTRQEIVP
jgi:Kef-type K+ transport system membrane component KefB